MNDFGVARGGFGANVGVFFEEERAGRGRWVGLGAQLELARDGEADGAAAYDCVRKVGGRGRCGREEAVAGEEVVGVCVGSCFREREGDGGSGGCSSG